MCVGSGHPNEQGYRHFYDSWKRLLLLVFCLFVCLFFVCLLLLLLLGFFALACCPHVRNGNTRSASCHSWLLQQNKFITVKSYASCIWRSTLNLVSCAASIAGITFVHGFQRTKHQLLLTDILGRELALIDYDVPTSSQRIRKSHRPLGYTLHGWTQEAGSYTTQWMSKKSVLRP